MLRALWDKIREAATSVLPVTLIVLLLGFTPLVFFSTQEIVAFLIAAAALILGMALFNLGADMAMTPMGEQVGSGLSKSRNLWLLLFACFLLGAFVTIAEPDVSVLAANGMPSRVTGARITWRVRSCAAKTSLGRSRPQSGTVATRFRK